MRTSYSMNRQQLSFPRHVHPYVRLPRASISITPSSDDRLGFKELPENDLDKSGRKCLAALGSTSYHLNATDNSE